MSTDLPVALSPCHPLPSQWETCLPDAPHCITKAEAQRTLRKSPPLPAYPSFPRLTRAPQPHTDTTLTSFPQAGQGFLLSNNDCYHLLGTCSGPDSYMDLISLHVYNSPLRRYHYPHCLQEITEAQRSLVTYTKSKS